MLGGATLAGAAESPRRIRVGFLGITYSHFKDKYLLLQSSPDYDRCGRAIDGITQANFALLEADRTIR